MSSDRSAELEFRRAPHLLLHWQENELVLHNYAVGRTLAAEGVVHYFVWELCVRR
jgi:hypothetical protein